MEGSIDASFHWTEYFHFTVPDKMGTGTINIHEFEGSL